MKYNLKPLRNAALFLTAAIGLSGCAEVPMSFFGYGNEVAQKRQEHLEQLGRNVLANLRAHNEFVKGTGAYRVLGTSIDTYNHNGRELPVSIDSGTFYLAVTKEGIPEYFKLANASHRKQREVVNRLLEISEIVDHPIYGSRKAIVLDPNNSEQSKLLYTHAFSLGEFIQDPSGGDNSPVNDAPSERRRIFLYQIVNDGGGNVITLLDYARVPSAPIFSSFLSGEEVLDFPEELVGEGATWKELVKASAGSDNIEDTNTPDLEDEITRLEAELKKKGIKTPWSVASITID